MKKTNYLERAKLLGQDIEALKRGETITSTVLINSVAEFKTIFGDQISAEQRAAFEKSTPRLPKDGYRTPFVQPVMNLMHHVYANYELTKADKEYEAKFFPMKIKVMSGQDITISTDEKVGPLAPPYAINAGTLTFDGGSLTVITTTLSITADTLSLKASGTKPYHLGIYGFFGASGPQGANGANFNARAQDGSPASAPTPGICTGASNGGKGADGSKGNPGNAPDLPGADGQSNYPSNIVCNAFQSDFGQFAVFTQSGPGGDGGFGGTGGTGQDGGNGGDGCDSGCEGTDGGNGGSAGEGGNGGNGGQGGNGATGININITFPKIAQGAVATNSEAAPVGLGGKGGLGGDAGSPGQAGGGGKNKSDGVAGGGALGGTAGGAGSPGAKEGVAGNIVVDYTL